MGEAQNHMKTTPLIPLLICLSALAQSPPAAPQNLRVVTSSVVGDIVGVPVISTNGQLIACLYSPPYIQRTNINQSIATAWIPEVSTDGVNWLGVRSEFVLLPPREIRALRQPCLTCLHSIEVSNATDQVRIRLVAY